MHQASHSRAHQLLVTPTGTLYRNNRSSSTQITKFIKKGADFMQLQKAEREQINARSGRFSHRIGSTVFTVNIISKEDSKETLEDKVLRLIKRDLESGSNRAGNSEAALKNAGNTVKMDMPQADWLPGRGSV
jgi:hypothetical protein